MPIKTVADLKRFLKEPVSEVKKQGCGQGVHVEHHPNGSIYFKGRITVNISGKSKRSEFHIGTYDKDFSLNEAKEKYQRIKAWCQDNNREPKDYSISKKVLIPHTFGDAVDGFIRTKKEGKHAIRTWENYQRIFHKDILTVIPPHTPLDSLRDVREVGGRQIVDEALNTIEKNCRGSGGDLRKRSQQLIRQSIEYAVQRGWFTRNENPAVALSTERDRRGHQHHPTLPWSEVPELLEKVSLNMSSASTHTVLAMKFLFLTALRTSALAQLEWSMIDENQEMITITGETTGVKRYAQSRHIPHKIPITKHLREIIVKCKKLNRGEPYLFLSEGFSKNIHLCPEAPNRMLINLGYQRRQTAHGWRRTILTNGKEILKEKEEVIRKQMGHLPKGKVAKAYDGSELIDERYNFLTNWGNLLVEKGLEI